MKQSRVAVFLTLASAACSAACGLSGDGTAASLSGDGGDHDATAAHGDSGYGTGGGDDALPGEAGSDAAVGDATLGDDSMGEDAGGEGGDASTGEDGADGTSPERDGAAADADAGATDASADAPTVADSGPVDATTEAGSADGGVDASGPVDAAADHQDGSTTDAGAGADASLDGGACDFDGTWASRLTIDVTWAPQGLTGIILASGSGQIKQWIKGVRVQTGTSTSDATVVCGVDLPDFQETAIAGGETYGVRFPDSLFDADGGYLPTFTVSAVLSGFTPGSTYDTTTTAALLGLSMTHPTTDPWPATITTEIDMDDDGKPGVTIDTAKGSPYSDIPSGIPGLFQPPARANKLYVAIRQVTVVTGTVTDCDHMAGTVSIPQIQSKYAIDSHVMGCALVDGGDCSTTGGSSQATFVDNTQPVFTPSGTTDFHSVRLATGATCADVRAELP